MSAPARRGAPVGRGTYGRLTDEQADNGFVIDVVSEIRKIAEMYALRFTIQQKNGDETIIGVYLPKELPRGTEPEEEEDPKDGAR